MLKAEETEVWLPGKIQFTNALPVIQSKWQILGSVQDKAELSSTFIESSFLQNNPIHFGSGYMPKTYTHELLKGKRYFNIICKCHFYHVNVSAISAQQV